MADPVKPKKSVDRPKREIPAKCKKCALMDMAWVHEKHGGTDGCWEPKVCYSRRYNARNPDRRKVARNLKRQEGLREIKVGVPELLYGVLVVYRPAGDRTPVHALAGEVWNAHGQWGFIEPRHCAGMPSSRVEDHVREFLDELEKVCGLKKFALEVCREEHECPIRPCPKHSAGRYESL
jgi:hypothetical protein